MTSRNAIVIKRTLKRGSEPFQKGKLHSSIRAACLSVQCRPGEADSIADKVYNDSIAWLDNKPEITSNDLRRVTAKHLKKYHPDAAYIYEHQYHTL